MPHAARLLALIESAVGLGGVPDHVQIVLRCDRQDGIHVCALSIKMHWKDGAGFRRNSVGNLRRVDRVTLRVDVYKYGGRPCPYYCETGRNKAVRNRDHLVARPASAGSQRKVQRFS